MRELALSILPAEVGVKPAPHQAYAVLLETGLISGSSSLLALIDGHLNLYMSDGGGSLGDSAKADVKASAVEMVEVANKLVSTMKPATSAPVPQTGQVQLFVITPECVYYQTAERAEIEGGKDPLSNIFALGMSAVDLLKGSVPPPLP